MSNPVIKSGAPTLMGNIGPTKNKYLNPVAQMDLDHKQREERKKLFSEMAEEFDIDNVIPEARRGKEVAKDAEGACERRECCRRGKWSSGGDSAVARR